MTRLLLKKAVMRETFRVNGLLQPWADGYSA